MSLSEPLAWPFRPEQLEALAARIREWNGTAFKVEPASWSWSSALGTLRRLGSEPPPPVEVEITPDISSAPAAEEQPALSQVSVDPAGAPVDVDSETPNPAGFVSVIDDVYANSQNRSVSFDSMSDAWGGGSDFSEAAGTQVVPPVAPEEIAAKPFVPAFERDDEDDSELDIKPSDRARLNENTPPKQEQPGPASEDSDDDEDDEGWNV